MSLSTAPGAGLFVPAILDNHANPVCDDMTITASYPPFRACRLEARANADAAGEPAVGSVSSLRIPPSLAASHSARIAARCAACGPRCGLAYELPLFTRYAIKARR